MQRALGWEVRGSRLALAGTLRALALYRMEPRSAKLLIEVNTNGDSPICSTGATIVATIRIDKGSDLCKTRVYSPIMRQKLQVTHELHVICICFRGTRIVVFVGTNRS
jgi:hypothetical protein